MPEKRLTAEEMRRIRLDHAKTLNWHKMDDLWRQRWAILLLSDEKLETKFFDLLISFFPKRGDGISPPIELLAAIGERQPRAVINHTTRLHGEGWLPRTSGCGRGNTSVYALGLPKKTQDELAALLGIKVQDNAPFDQENMQQDAPIEKRKVQGDAPFSEKRCILTSEKVHLNAPPLFSFLKDTSHSVPNGGMNGHHHEPKSGARKQASVSGYSETFEAFWPAYRAAMKNAGGKAAARAATSISKGDANKVWVKLNPDAQAAAQRFLPGYAHSKGEYMQDPDNYLKSAPWEAAADEQAADHRAAQSKDVQILAMYAASMDWNPDFQERFGPHPPGHPQSTVPRDLWQQAKTLHELQAGAGNARH